MTCYISVYLDVFIRRKGEGGAEGQTAVQRGDIAGGTHRHAAEVRGEVPEGPVRAGCAGGRGRAGALLEEFQHVGGGRLSIGIENNFNVLMLHGYIRKILRLDNRQSFFLKIRNQIRRTSDNIGELFKRYAEEDGFLYIQIKKENIF